MIIAAELGAALRLTSGPALERAGDLAAILSNLVEGDVLFIDEIHRIARPAEEIGVITREIARAALAVYDVDELGLDRLDRSVLSALCRSFGGGRSV